MNARLVDRRDPLVAFHAAQAEVARRVRRREVLKGTAVHVYGIARGRWSLGASSVAGPASERPALDRPVVPVVSSWRDRLGRFAFFFMLATGLALWGTFAPQMIAATLVIILGFAAGCLVAATLEALGRL